MLSKIIQRFRKGLALCDGFVAFICLEFARTSAKGNLCGVRLRCAPKRVVYFRNGTSDYATMLDCFLMGFHRPLRPLSEKPVILDLGANVGYSMIDFHFQHPNARIFGVELDARNVVLAQKNIEGLGMEIIQAAVSHKDGHITYNADAPFNAFKANSSVTNGLRAISVESMTVGSLFQKFKINNADYVKVDIEGAEKDLLLSGDLSWLHFVRQVNIEIHGGIDTKSVSTILRKWGFQTEEKAIHWNAVFGWKL